MKLCRFDEDRLGVVIGDKVHDVTEAQTQIRAAARYGAARAGLSRTSRTGFVSSSSATAPLDFTKSENDR